MKLFKIQLILRIFNIFTVFTYRFTCYIRWANWYYGVSHFRGHLGPANFVKKTEILVNYIIFGMFLLLFPVPQIFHLVLSG